MDELCFWDVLAVPVYWALSLGHMEDARGDSGRSRGWRRGSPRGRDFLRGNITLSLWRTKKVLKIAPNRIKKKWFPFLFFFFFSTTYNQEARITRHLGIR